MGMQATTTKLTYARNDYIKVGHSFIFDRVGDMIYYAAPLLDKANTFTAGNAFGSRTAGSGLDLGTYEEGLLVAAQYTDAAVLANITDYVGCAGIFELKISRAITADSGAGYGFASLWSSLELDKAIASTGGISAGWFSVWADASGDDANLTGTTRVQGVDIAIVSGADLNAGASTKIYGLRIDSSVLDSAEAVDGEFAAIHISKSKTGATKKDWKIGIDINDCTTGIDIGDGTTGINFSGTTTYFANWDSAAGAAIVNTHEIESHALQHIIKVKIGDDTGYIFVFDSVPIGG